MRPDAINGAKSAYVPPSEAGSLSGFGGWIESTEAMTRNAKSQSSGNAPTLGNCSGLNSPVEIRLDPLRAAIVLKFFVREALP